MSDFGKYAVLTPVTHTFEKEPTWQWVIKPVTMEAEMSIAQLMSVDRFAIFPDGTRVNRNITTQEISLREIALTFQSTTIPSDDGKPILDENASVADVETALKAMPPALVLEIWTAVGKACPPWGPAIPEAKKDKEPKNSKNSK